MAIKSRRIRLDGTCDNKDISVGSSWYLAHTIFGWRVGQFHRVWFGLTLQCPHDVVVAHQLDSIDDLYEIEFPRLRPQPTQYSREKARRRAAGVCLECGAKGTPGYPHSRGCKSSPGQGMEVGEEDY
jgi:hypothetical protein